MQTNHKEIGGADFNSAAKSPIDSVAHKYNAPVTWIGPERGILDVLKAEYRDTGTSHLSQGDS